jgi:hypothetical protein
LREFLYSQPDLASRLTVVGKEDRIVTGNFTVTVSSTGQVLHAKGATDTCHQGVASTDEERDLIVEQIQDVLGSMLS